MDKPTLLVVAGCNGSGKSSFSKALVPNGIIPFDYDIHYLKIYKSLIDSDLRDVMAHNAARTKLEKVIEESIRSKTDFCYETNFNSTPLFWPYKFKESGFNIEVIYFCLDSIKEAKKRVQIRVENGGHFVPEHEIVQRYKLGFENLNNHFQFFNRVHLIYSSLYKEAPQHILSLEKGQVIAKSYVPDYLSKLLPDIIRLTK